MKIELNAFYDADASVWCAASVKMPDGFAVATSAPTKDDLLKRLSVIIPDLLSGEIDVPLQDLTITINWQAMKTVEKTKLLVA